MAGFSTYLSQAIIEYSLRGGTFTKPTAYYLAIFTSDPTDANVTANEVAGAWYARQATGSWAASGGAGNNMTSNNAQIQYAAVTGAAVTVSHWGIYDALTVGNLLYSGALAASKTLNVGDVLVVGANQLAITIE